jgi:hypothetical protein
MTRTSENVAPLEPKAACSIVVVHEDLAARARAMEFCDQCIGRFWERFEFEANWWSFAMLEEPNAANDAAEKAIRADLILFSATAEGDFSRPIKTWIETWLSRRGEREGALVGLLEPPTDAGGCEGQKHHYLRLTAQRGAMDYLTQVPQTISRSIPDSLDSYTRRADQVTSLLDDILHQHAPPPSLLL